jgi:rhamnosyltransferase
MTATPAISIIMRSKDSAWVIDRALAALFSQTRRDFELIVVDSGSTDRTLEIVRGYPCRLVSIAPEKYFPGPVLNDAIALARAPLIVFQNSDVVPLNARALEALVAPFSDGGVSATFARQIPRPEAHTWVRRDYDAAFPAHGEAPPWMPYSLPFAAMRRSAWEQQPFYTEAWGSEDTHWGHRAREAGRVVRYVPDAVVMHSHNYTLRQLYGRRFIEGEADAFILPGRASTLEACAGAAASLARDAGPHLRAGDLRGLLLAPLRRAVFHYGYVKGRWWGESRRRRRDDDASVGQREVLSRYG